ncbi:MAG: glycoside hydrolase family 172 protein [Acidobacteriota bacterium]
MRATPFRLIATAALAAVLAAALAAQDLNDLMKPQPGRSMRASTGDLTENEDAIHLDKGESRTIILQGPGKIEHIWFIASSMDIRYPRAVVLRVYWDGSPVPSVETPVGDFFGVGNGMRADIDSLPVKASSFGRGYNCYWPMPFRREARIVVTNESDREPAGIFYQVDWVKWDQAPEDLLYFHARYHQEYPPQMGQPYTVFVGEGRGHYVGTVLSSQNAIGHWYGEGDDFFYIDGEKQPSILGTGTEDYFNDAWNMRVHSTLFTGCTVFEPRGIDARITAYRWHVADPILFSKSLRFEIERKSIIMNAAGQVVDDFKPRPDHWSSVAYWYQDGIARPWCPFPPYRERVNPEIVLHLPKVAATMTHSPGVELQVLPYNRATWTKPWFRVRNDAVGSWVEIPFDIKEKGRYSMSLFQTLREDQGIWKVLVDGREIYDAGESQISGNYSIDEVALIPKSKINKVLDFYNIYKKNEHEDYTWGQGRERKIGLFEFAPGRHTLRLVCIGANPSAVDAETGKPGYNMAADILSLRKLPFEHTDEWIDQVLKLEKGRI